MSLQSLIDKMLSQQCPDAQLDPPEPRDPICPLCGKVCNIVYKEPGGDIVGCDNCLRAVDAWECSECNPDE